MAFTFDARWLIDSSFSFWDWPYILLEVKNLGFFQFYRRDQFSYRSCSALDEIMESGLNAA